MEKRSRFIGYITPVQTEEQALRFIKEIKSKHWDATHNVYAYILRDKNIMRYSDDGEPQGTAGMPVLDVLRKKELCDVAVVVTRYFGGILLGGGGLVRAYTKGAAIAVEAGEPVCKKECPLCRIRCDYNFYGKASSAIADCGGYIDSTDFAADVMVDFHIEEENLGALTKKITDLSSGGVKIEQTDSAFFDIKI